MRLWPDEWHFKRASLELQLTTGHWQLKLQLATSHRPRRPGRVGKFWLCLLVVHISCVNFGFGSGIRHYSSFVPGHVSVVFERNSFKLSIVWSPLSAVCRSRWRCSSSPETGFQPVLMRRISGKKMNRERGSQRCGPNPFSIQPWWLVAPTVAASGSHGSGAFAFSWPGTLKSSQLTHIRAACLVPCQWFPYPNTLLLNPIRSHPIQTHSHRRGHFHSDLV